MSADEEAKAYELVRVQGLSYAAAGKLLGGMNKSTVRAAVTREAVRRARVDGGHTAAPPAAPPPGADAGFLAALLDAPPRAPVADRLHVAPAEPAPDDDLTLDVGAWLQRQIKKLERHIDALQADGNVGEAQKHTRTLAGLAAELRKYNKEKRADDGVLTYTLDDVTRIREEIKKIVEDTAGRAPVCAECGRAMRKREAEG